MNKTTFNLGTKESTRFVLISQFIFGLICIGTAVMWGLFILKGGSENEGFWAPTVFLLLFGFYQIYSGLGKASRYIKFEGDTITIKKAALGKERVISVADISKIVVSTTGFTIHNSGSGSIKVRFGMTHPESALVISDTLAEYASANNIELESTDNQV